MLLYRQRTSQRTWLLHHSGPKKPHRAGPMGLTDGGAIIFAGSIIGLLCTLSHEASLLYIRTPLGIGPGLGIMLDTNFREFLF